MPSSSKENVRSTMSTTRPAAMSEGDVFSLTAASEMMLSPPPEEELRYSRRHTNEPSSASRPLANSMRPNQPSPSAYQTSKRKRTITGASPHKSPIALQDQQDSAIGVQHTPNPRLRKQVRHAVASPNPTNSIYANASLGSPVLGGGSSRPQGQEEAPMTPTRKGKSRGRSVDLVPQSPYASNPDADYIPIAKLAISPRGVSVRRRSVTPIPPYEPPKERYTPPREVVVSPPPPERKPARRTKKKRVSVKVEKPPVQLWVKTEPPEIDLTTPAPPASPGDDPILLVGPPAIRVQRPSLPPSDSRDVSLVNFEMDLDLPENRERVSSRPSQHANVPTTPARSDPSIPPAFDFSKFDDDDGGLVNNGCADTSSDGDFGTVIDDGAFANVNDDGWSDTDSDNDKGEGTSIGEGDFTGRFLSFKAPVKLDPPADDSDDRMEKWARPISPHPKRLSLVQPKEEDLDVPLGNNEQTVGQATNDTRGNDELAGTGNDSENDEGVQETRGPRYEDRRGRRLTLSEVEAIKFGPEASPPKSVNDSAASAGNGRPDEDNTTGVEHVSLDQNTPPKEENEASPARSSSEHSSGESSQTTLNNPDMAVLDYQNRIESEEQEVRLLKYGRSTKQADSASLLRAPSPPNGLLSDCETELATEEDQDGDSDGGASDLSVVKIMSDDPMAAARAAAILKMHDYDMVARKLRRRQTTAGGITKAYSTPKDMQRWRRRTVAGLSAEDALSANISLPELLVKAEEELRSSPARSRSGSLALSSVGSPQKPRWIDLMYDNADTYGLREWTKADWKLLDSCFTDERYDLGEQMGLEPGCLAEVDDVPLESVIERFVEVMGGTEIVESHGHSWTMEKLMSRARALCKRQRAGQGAPPTPDVSARFSTPSRFLTLSPTSSMIVPDFTPSAAERVRLFDSGSVNRKARLPPPSSESFFKVPSTLPARHSRLRDDVTSAVLETPRPGRALDLFGFATPSRNQHQDDSDDESVVQEVDAMLTPIAASRMRQTRPESAVKRSLSYISSWLKPDMYKSKKEERKGLQFPALPVPPSDVLSKPRGPVETPAPKPPAKVVPPKELVDLEHVPPPPPTKLPRPRKPRRLVDLNHVPTPQGKDEVKRSLSRRSSTSSVRDLIKEFEDKDKGKAHALPPRVAELRRQASVGSLKSKGKPAWKP